MPVRVNWDEGDRENGKLMPPGAYLVSIKSAKETTSGPNSKVPGSPMFEVVLRGVEDDFTVFDSLSLTGGGWGIAKAKLKALGVLGQGTGELAADALVGRRAWISVIHETYKGKTKMRVDVNAGDHCGFYSADDPPLEALPSTKPAPAEDNDPFGDIAPPVLRPASDDASKVPF